jgi:hypothetical protein
MASRSTSIVLALALTAHSFAICAATPGGLETVPENNQGVRLAHLRIRFATLQQIARPNDGPFELRLVDAGFPLFGQDDDGIVRLPADWVAFAPDGETLDFLMLLGLANAIAREPEPRRPSTATKIITGTLDYVGANLADNRRTLHLPAPHFASSTSPSELAPASRALTWTTATGDCEARIVAGLHKLKAINGPIGQDVRQILKALGPVAWTPYDRCRPPAN